MFYQGVGGALYRIALTAKKGRGSFVQSREQVVLLLWTREGEG